MCESPTFPDSHNCHEKNSTTSIASWCTSIRSWQTENRVGMSSLMKMERIAFSISQILRAIPRECQWRASWCRIRRQNPGRTKKGQPLSRTFLLPMTPTATNADMRHLNLCNTRRNPLRLTKDISNTVMLTCKLSMMLSSRRRWRHGDCGLQRDMGIQLRCAKS